MKNSDKMNEDFVTYELAVKLKEKGFPFKYKTEGKLGLTEIRKIEILPCINEILKWFRKEKKIYVSILPFATYSTINKVAFYYLIEYNSTGETMEGIEQNTYCAEWNDAALAGIEYVLDNLI